MAQAQHPAAKKTPGARWQRICKVRKGFDIEVETTVCGGFPIVILACWEKADPSVGYFDESYTDATIYTNDFHRATFIEKKMTALDWERVDLAIRREL